MRSISFLLLGLVAAVVVVHGVNGQTANITMAIFESSDSNCQSSVVGQPYTIPSDVCFSAPPPFQALNVMSLYLSAYNETSEWQLSFYGDNQCQDGSYFLNGRGDICSLYTNDPYQIPFEINIPITSPCSLSIYNSARGDQCQQDPSVTYGLGEVGACNWAKFGPTQSWNFTLFQDASKWQLLDYVDGICQELSDDYSGEVGVCSPDWTQLIICNQEKLISEI